MVDGVLSKCLNQGESKALMDEMQGVCGAHQSAYKVKLMFQTNGYFGPTMLEDCFEYYKGC